MQNLTSQQVRHLADNFLRMTNALGNYRYENFEYLSKEDNLKIKELHRKQLEYTTELYTKSAVLVLNEVATSLQQIDAITKETVNLYKNLGKVQKILDRATSVLTLASAIVSLNIENISSSMKSLLIPIG